MSLGTVLMTAEEFGQRPDRTDGLKEELVRGEIVTMAFPKPRHGRVVAKIMQQLGNYLDENPIGFATAETGVQTEHDPDSVRGPDATYCSFDRFPPGFDDTVYFEVAADLCIEVRSPSNRRRDWEDKAGEYLRGGVRMVWLVDPDDQTVTVYREPEKGRKLSNADTLDGEDVLPGFSCPVSKLFPA